MLTPNDHISRKEGLDKPNSTPKTAIADNSDTTETPGTPKLLTPNDHISRREGLDTPSSTPETAILDDSNTTETPGTPNDHKDEEEVPDSVPETTRQTDRAPRRSNRIKNQKNHICCNRKVLLAILSILSITGVQTRPLDILARAENGERSYEYGNTITNFIERAKHTIHDITGDEVKITNDALARRHRTRQTETKARLRPQSTKTLIIGDDSTLICPSNIKDAVKYEWTREDGNTVTPGRKSKLGFYLHLHRTRERDSGTFICTTTTKNGTTSNSKIKVKAITHTLNLVAREHVTNQAGVITGYSCMQVGNRLATLDLSTIESCDPIDTKPYLKSKETTTILYRAHTIETSVIRCELRIKVRTASCGKGFGGYLKYSHALGFTISDEYTYQLTRFQCNQAQAKKLIPLKFGLQKLIIKPVGATTRTKAYLHGSALFNNQTCIGALGPVFLGREREEVTTKSNLIVELTTTLTVIKEKALIDVRENQILIPRLGIEQKIEPSGIFLKQTEQGTITKNLENILPRTKCLQYKRIKVFKTEYYKANQAIPEHNETPDIVTAELTPTNPSTPQTTLGLQLMEQEEICGRTCHSTQLQHLYVCTGLMTEVRVLSDQTRIRELGSQGVTHLQLHTSRTLSDIMFAMCESRRLRLKDIIRDFNKNGPRALFPDHPGGLKSIIRGQAAYIFDCLPKIVHPTALGNGSCCAHLPVLVPMEHGKTELQFLEPHNMELTNSCNPVKCSDSLPVIYKNNDGVSLCQRHGDLTTCDSGQKLDPTNQNPPIFQPLTKAESNTNIAENMMKEDMQLIAMESIAHTEFQNRITGTIARNVVNCRNKEICWGAATLPEAWQTELSRLVNSNDQFFLQQTSWGRIVVGIAYAWAVYCIFTGFITLIVRCRTRWTSELGSQGSCSCIGLCLACFKDLDQALNPLSTTKDRLNTRILSQEQHTIDIEMSQKLIRRQIDKLKDEEKEHQERVEDLEKEIQHIGMTVEGLRHHTNYAAQQ